MAGNPLKESPHWNCSSLGNRVSEGRINFFRYILLDLGIKSGCYVCFSWEDILILLCYRLIVDGDMVSYVHCRGNALMLVGHRLCVELFCVLLQYICTTIFLLHLHPILKHLLVVPWIFFFSSNIVTMTLCVSHKESANFFHGLILFFYV